MYLSPFITKKQIILDAILLSKKRIIEVLANIIEDNRGIKSEYTFKQLYDREHIGTTYVGQGVFMPHCRLKSLNFTTMIIITLKNPYYDAQTQSDINIIVGVFFPERTTQMHFDFLSQLASFLKTDGNKDKIMNFKNDDALLNFLENIDNSESER